MGCNGLQVAPRGNVRFAAGRLVARVDCGMDYTLPFEIEVAPPLGDTHATAFAPVSGYAVIVDEEGAQLRVAIQRRFWRGDGAGIAQNLGGGTASADAWPEFAPELVVDAAIQANVPALPQAFALLLGRPDVVDWDDELRVTVLEWPDDRVRSAAVLPLRDVQ